MSFVRENIGTTLTTMLFAAVTAYAASLVFPETKQKVKEKLSRILLISDVPAQESSTSSSPIDISNEHRNQNSLRLINLEKFRFTPEEINRMESTTVTAVRNESWKLLQDILALTEIESPSSSPTYSASYSYEKKLNTSKLSSSSSSSTHLSPSGESVLQRLNITEEDLLALSTSERIELARFLASTINFANEKLNDIRERHELCRICEDEPKTVAFDPCGHFGCCEACAKSCPTCPWCREGELTDNGVRKMSLHVV